jgi:hypothetical protein
VSDAEAPKAESEPPRSASIGFKLGILGKPNPKEAAEDPSSGFDVPDTEPAAADDASAAAPPAETPAEAVSAVDDAKEVASDRIQLILDHQTREGSKNSVSKTQRAQMASFVTKVVEEVNQSAISKERCVFLGGYARHRISSASAILRCEKH